MNDFWLQVAASAVGFVPAAAVIYMLAYWEGRGREKERVRSALEDAWNDGWDSLRLEYVRQATDKSYPIRRENPHEAGR